MATCKLTEPVLRPNMLLKIDIAAGEDAGQVTQLQTHAEIRTHSAPNRRLFELLSKKFRKAI